MGQILAAFEVDLLEGVEPEMPESLLSAASA
jgi:hypothetical protein